MVLSRKNFGSQGYKNPKDALKKDALDIAKALSALGQAPLKDGQMKKILAKGSEPLIKALQEEYMASDPSKLGGDIAIKIIVKLARKRQDRVYIGPDKRSKGYQLWYILQWGTVARVMKKGLRAGDITQETMEHYKGPGYWKPKAGKSTGVMPGKHFMERAQAKSKTAVIQSVSAEFQAYMAKVGKKLGFDVTG